MKLFNKIFVNTKKTIFRASYLLLVILFVVSIQHLASALPSDTPDFVSDFGEPIKDDQLNYPNGITLDYNDDVYVANSDINIIKKTSRTGAYITQWGGSGSGNGQFNYVRGLASDSSSNIYVVDDGNSRIQKFDSSGNYISQWGTSGSGNGQFSGPWGIAIDSSDNVYISDTNNNRIQKFDSSGNYISQWGTSGSGNGQFFQPQGLAIAKSAGFVYVGDMGNNRIQRFDQTGTYLEKWASPNPKWLAVGRGGNNIHAVDAYNDVIYKYSPTGGFVAAGGGPWGGTGTGDGQFTNIGGIATDNGADIFRVDLFITDTGGHRIQQFDTQAFSPIIYQSKWGSRAHSDNDQFGDYVSTSVGPNGNIYVVDRNFDRIKVFNSAGTYVTSWGSNGSGNGEFSGPQYSAVDSDGNVYISDNGNSRIQKFSSTGTYLAQWGSNGSGNSEFDGVGALATDTNNNVYAIDSYNSRIQKFSSTGTYLAQWGSNGSADGEFGFSDGEIESIAIDSYNNIYVTDNSNTRVQKFNTNGTYITKWGSAGAGNGQFNYPNSIAVDSNGYVYVTDNQNTNIQKFSSTGTYLAQWGSVGAGNGEFFEGSDGALLGITISDDDEVYIVDAASHRIQKFEYSSPQIVPALDTDGDGVSDDIENANPLGADINNDSIPDATQSKVVSRYNNVGGAYTAAVVEGCVNGFTNFENQKEQDTDNDDAGYSYPLGLQAFTASCVNPGATAQLKIYYDKVYDTANWTHRKYIPSRGFIDFSSNVTYSVVDVNGTSVTVASFSVIDGSEFDADGVVNGIVVDPIGVAIADLANGGSLAKTGISTLVQEIIGGALLVVVLIIAPKQTRKYVLNRNN